MAHGALLQLASLLAFAVDSVVPGGSTGELVSCFDQGGATALSRSAAYPVCGEMVHLMEGFRRVSITYSPLPLYEGCSRVCVGTVAAQLYFTLDWCSAGPPPSLLLQQYIREVEFSGEQRKDRYLLYGCADNYRAKFELIKNTSCYEKSCVPLVAYALNRTLLPVRPNATSATDKMVGKPLQNAVPLSLILNKPYGRTITTTTHSPNVAREQHQPNHSVLVLLASSYLVHQLI